MTKIEKIIIVVIVALLGVIVGVAYKNRDAKAAFLASCAKAEPEYQCEVKWKQMHPDPLVIYMPMNR